MKAVKEFTHLTKKCILQQNPKLLRKAVLAVMKDRTMSINSMNRSKGIRLELPLKPQLESASFHHFYCGWGNTFIRKISIYLSVKF